MYDGVTFFPVSQCLSVSLNFGEMETQLPDSGSSSPSVGIERVSGDGEEDEEEVEARQPPRRKQRKLTETPLFRLLDQRRLYGHRRYFSIDSPHSALDTFHSPIFSNLLFNFVFFALRVERYRFRHTS